jgi:hypothetical protein
MKTILFISLISLVACGQHKGSDSSGQAAPATTPAPDGKKDETTGTPTDTRKLKINFADKAGLNLTSSDVLALTTSRIWMTAHFLDSHTPPADPTNRYGFDHDWHNLPLKVTAVNQILKTGAVLDVAALEDAGSDCQRGTCPEPDFHGTFSFDVLDIQLDTVGVILADGSYSGPESCFPSQSGDRLRLSDGAGEGGGGFVACTSEFKHKFSDLPALSRAETVLQWPDAQTQQQASNVRFVFMRDDWLTAPVMTTDATNFSRTLSETEQQYVMKFLNVKTNNTYVNRSGLMYFIPAPLFSVTVEAKASAPTNEGGAPQAPANLLLADDPQPLNATKIDVSFDLSDIKMVGGVPTINGGTTGAPFDVKTTMSVQQ